MEKGLEGILQKIEGGKKRKVYVPDTNVIIDQPDAVYILASDWESVRETSHGRGLIERHQRNGELDTEPNDVIVLDLIEEEIDDIMHNPKKEGVKSLARRARSNLYNIRRQGQVGIQKGASFVELQNGARVYFVKHDEGAYLQEKRADKADNRMAWNFGRLVRAYKESDFQFTFVSQDISCRSKVRDEVTDVYAGEKDQKEKTDACESEFRFENATEDPHQLYTGVIRVRGTSEDFELFSHGMISLEQESRLAQLRKVDIKANQFIELQAGEKKSALVVSSDATVARSLDNYAAFLEHVKGSVKDNSPTQRVVEVPTDVTLEMIAHLIEASGIDNTSERYHNLRKMLKRARKDVPRAYREVQETIWAYEKPVRFGHLNFEFNPGLTPVAEQQYALEALMNPEIHAVSVEGPQGSGKTIWALWAGLVQVDQKKYGKVVYYRPPRGMNKGHGFLPGGERDKIDPWTKSCEDALMDIFYGIKGNGSGILERKKSILGRLERDGILEYGVDTAQQGRTWGPNFIVMDETQNYTLEEIRLLAGRPGIGTKLVLLGDRGQIGATHEVTHTFLTSKNSGLAHVIAKYQGKPRYAHVTLGPDCVKRSEIALYARDL